MKINGIPYRSIRLDEADGWSIRILDQTRLPWQVEWLRLSQQAEAARSRQGQLDDELAEVDAGLEQLQERRALGEARFEELDLQLADAQQRHAELEEEVITQERRVADAREQQRALERQAQEAQFQVRALAARRGELQRTIETAQEQIRRNVETGA